MKSKFDLGDTVFFIKNGKIVSDTITAIDMKKGYHPDDLGSVRDISIEVYNTCENDKYSEIDVDSLFSSKKELIEYISKE